MRNNKRTPPNADKGEVTGNWKSGPKELHIKEPRSRCTKEYICVYGGDQSQRRHEANVTEGTLTGQRKMENKGKTSTPMALYQSSACTIGHKI